MERKILSLIINTIGNGTHVYLEEITDYSKDYINAKKFMKEYDNWKAKAIEISNLENFYESTFKVKLKSTLYSLIMPALSFLTLNLTLYLGKFYLVHFIRSLTSLLLLSLVLSYSQQFILISLTYWYTLLWGSYSPSYM